MTDSFDSDVIIYAGVPGHPLGRRIRALLRGATEQHAAGLGSVLLLPEVLTKPIREDRMTEVDELNDLLGRIDLHPLDEATADLAAVLGAAYGLRAADAAHLATAVVNGADRFITNNTKDFPRSIAEIDIVYPTDLPDPG